jgi:hypothetical protein
MDGNPPGRTCRMRCGECVACLSEDCKTCSDCVRKKKYGGDGSSKLACIKRRCLNLRYRADNYGYSNKSRRGNSNGAGTDGGNGSYGQNGVVPAESSVPRQQPPVVSNGYGTVTFHPPASLIQIPSDSDDPFRAENMDGEPNQRRSSATAAFATSRRKRPRYEALRNECPTSIHFVGLPAQKKICGACGKCGMNEEELDDTIILCDGPGCDQEFHLQCCIPPLSEVPSGSFYCFDCSQHGSTAFLKAYLDEMEEARESYHYKSVIFVATSSNRTQSKNGAVGDIKSIGSRKAATETSYGTKTNARNIDHYPAIRETAATKNYRTNRTRRLAFVDHLLWKDVQDAHHAKVVSRDGSDSGDHPGCDGVTRHPHNHNHNQSIDGARIPHSELDVFHQQVRRSRHAITMVSTLVGKCLRLYCPRGNDYHHGRILSVLPSPDNLDIECLVRFPAGRDHRKSTLTRWLRLEEHSLAVATQLAWGLFSGEGTATSRRNPISTIINDDEIARGGGGPKNSVSSMTSNNTSTRPQWLRAQIWRRTSRELVNVMGLLQEELGQIRYRSVRYDDDDDKNGNGYQWDVETVTTSIGLARTTEAQDVCTIKSMQDPLLENHTPNLQDQEWVLAEILGRGSYQLLNLSTQTRGIGTSETGSCSSKVPNTPTKNPPRVPRTMNNTSNISTTTRETEIALALEEAELSEQARVLEWNVAFRLKNPWHKLVLTLQDEFALQPLTIFQSIDDSRPHADSTTTGEEYVSSNRIQPTPLVRPFLDRIYITNQLDESWGGTTTTRSKDLACSLNCGLVGCSITAFIQNQNLYERRKATESTVSGCDLPEVLLLAADAPTVSNFVPSNAAIDRHNDNANPSDIA